MIIQTTKIIIKGFLLRGKEIQPLSAYTVWRRTDERDIQIDLTNIEPTGKNRTINSNLLIYNRVPKCSSTTMKFLMQKLQKHNKFHAFFSTNYWRLEIINFLEVNIYAATVFSGNNSDSKMKDN